MHRSGFALVAIGLAAQLAPRQPKNKGDFRKHGAGTPTLAKAHANHASGAQAAARGAWRTYAARMVDRNASISERSTSASRRSSPEALSTSPAADPAWDEAAETPMILLETSEVPPAACWM